MFDGGIATTGDGNGGQGETRAKSGAQGATEEPNEKGILSSSPRETADSAPGDLDHTGMMMLGTVVHGVTEWDSIVNVEAGEKSLVAGAGSLSGEEEDSCHIPYSEPNFPSLSSSIFQLCMSHLSRISSATSVHHPI
ncbi:hypothetical protein EDD22DRAFT_959367 [Suillus occidentalis]|nr:hypothetical protein EDD22DRAFT_959367 [Suillus occidentalis]